LLVKILEKMGSEVDQNIIVKIAGGAQMEDENKTFNLGQRNVLAIKKTLINHGLTLNAEDTGSNIGRIMEVIVNTGEIFLSSPGRGKWKL